MPSVLPRLDPLDDEEALARLDQPEPPRLADKRRVARGVGELPFKLPLLVAEAPDFAGALHKRVTRVDVCVQRPVVEKPDEAERPDAEPASDEDGAPRTTAPPFVRWCGHGQSVFVRAARGPAGALAG